MLDPRRRSVEILLAVLVLAGLFSFWGFHYFPSQDGPSHLYNAHVMLTLEDAASPYGEVYERRPEFVPNWLAGAALVGMGKMMPLATAEKILLSVYFLAFVAAFAALARREEGLAPVALLGPAFALNYALGMGFYSFSLGSAAALWGWVVAARASRSTGRAAPWILAALGIVAFVSHVVAAGLLLLGAGVVAIREIWLRDSARPLLRGLLPLLPTAILVLHYLVGKPPSRTSSWTFGELLQVLGTLRGLASQTFLQPAVAITAALVLLALVVLRLVRRDLDDAERTWLMVAAGCIGAYLLLPNGSDGHWFLSERLSLFAWIALVPVARVASARLGQSLLLFLLAALFIGGTFPARMRLDDQLGRHESIAARIEPGSRLLGLTFGDPEPTPVRARPWLHANGRIAMARNGVDVGNYEADTDHFQLRFRPEVAFPDPVTIQSQPQMVDVVRFAPSVRYVVTRSLDERAARFRRTLERAYTEVAREGTTVLFERRAE